LSRRSVVVFNFAAVQRLSFPEIVQNKASIVIGEIGHLHCCSGRYFDCIFKNGPRDDLIASWSRQATFVSVKWRRFNIFNIDQMIRRPEDSLLGLGHIVVCLNLVGDNVGDQIVKRAFVTKEVNFEKEAENGQIVLGARRDSSTEIRVR